MKKLLLLLLLFPFTTFAFSGQFIPFLSWTLATGTSATTTNIFSTTASSTNLFGRFINGFGLTTCNSSNFLQWTGGSFACGTPSSGGGTWGSITGTLSNQTDLQTALDAKVPYTGASNNVDLGAFDFAAQTLTSTNGTIQLFNGGAIGFYSDSGSTPTGFFANPTFADYELYAGPNLASVVTASLDFTGLSSDRTFTFPNQAGTFGLLQAGQTWTGANIFNNITRSTTTAATTTSLFSTTASSTNLYAGLSNGCVQVTSGQLLSIGSNCGTSFTAVNTIATTSTANMATSTIDISSLSSFHNLRITFAGNTLVGASTSTAKTIEMWFNTFSATPAYADPNNNPFTKINILASGYQVDARDQAYASSIEVTNPTVGPFFAYTVGSDFSTTTTNFFATHALAEWIWRSANPITTISFSTGGVNTYFATSTTYTVLGY